MIAVRNVLLAVACLLAPVLLAGCLAVAAGAAAGTAAVYVRGSLNANFNAPVSEVASATRRALNEMNVAIVSENVSDLDAEFTARTAKDDRVKIRAKHAGDNITSISIRIGIFGDQDRSMAIYNRIRHNL